MSINDSENGAASQVGEPFPLSTLRHSVAHLMASAVGRLYPGVQYGIGPSIDHGFYYDFEFPEIDRLEWFDLATARVKLLTGQRPLVDQLQEAVGPAAPPASRSR